MNKFQSPTLIHPASCQSENPMQASLFNKRRIFAFGERSLGHVVLNREMKQLHTEINEVTKSWLINLFSIKL